MLMSPLSWVVLEGRISSLVVADLATAGPLTEKFAGPDLCFLSQDKLGDLLEGEVRVSGGQDQNLLLDGGVLL